MSKSILAQPSILETTDIFVDALAWDDRSKVVITQRRHGGRTYILCRRWDRDEFRPIHFPHRRVLVIPVAYVTNTATALRAAAKRTPLERRPKWCKSLREQPVQNGEEQQRHRPRERFIAAVGWGKRRVLAVFHRTYCGKTYVRLRIWNHHRVKSVWYPTQRGYVFARELAQQLADTIEIAATVTESNRPTPDWLTAWIDARARRVEWLEEANAPDKLVAEARERIRQLLQNPCWPRLPTHSRL